MEITIIVSMICLAIVNVVCMVLGYKERQVFMKMIKSKDLTEFEYLEQPAAPKEEPADESKVNIEDMPDL